MPPAVPAVHPPSTPASSAVSPVQRIALWAAAALVVLLLVALAFLVAHWPFRYGKIKPMLDNVFASDVEMAHYRTTYFPFPGFEADNLVLHRRSNDPQLPPLGTAQKLAVRGSWTDLLFFRKHVDVVDVEALHITLPPSGSRERQEDFPKGSSGDFSGPKTSIRQLVVRNGVFEIQKREAKPVVFVVHKLVLEHLAQHQAFRYAIDMINPKPTGHIVAHGNFGPLDPQSLGNTPFSGDFTFDNVKLSDIGKLRGELSSSGHFENTLASLATRASTDTPAFSVGEGRPDHLRADVSATVNALNGDVILNEITARANNTLIRAHGSVAGSPKLTRLEIVVPHGRAQDLMRPFCRHEPPIVGGVSLHTHAELAPRRKGEDFLSRLHMDGTLDVPDERITQKSTEEKLSAFSERAQGNKNKGKPDDPPDTDELSSLTGPVSLRNGVVSSQRVHFAVPGASADLHGTYSFRNQQVHMTGNLAMDSDLSHVATGFKSALLKPFAPFFHHKDHGAVFPIAITGGPGSYRVSGNFLHTK